MASSSSSSGGISAYRDRTSEFLSLSEKLKKKNTLSSSEEDHHLHTSNNKPSTSNSQSSEFKKKASQIGLGIFETSQRISRLAQLSKKSSLFNDPLKDIQQLTALIKDDITSLNMGLSDLQALQNIEIANENCSKDRSTHATTICDDLKTRLMGTTKQFQDVLTTRTENLKAHENRKQIFSTNALREKPFLSPAKSLTEPPPWSNNTQTDSQPSTMPGNGGQSGNQLRRRAATDNNPSQHMLQQVVHRQDDYMLNRASALQNVESTISELGGIFTQLASMVAQQGEVAIRIDDHMEESLSNVEGARDALLKNLSRISSNRWLLIKIFAVLIFFLMVFIIFVA